MKIIGVTGKAGSGKTTFSNMLEQYPEIGVVHTDEIVRNIKLRYFKGLMRKDANGEKTKVGLNLRKLLYANEKIFHLFMKFRAKLVEKKLQEEIQKYQTEGKKAVVIDDWFLQYHNYYHKLDFIVLMERPFIDRRTALMERDKMPKEEVVKRDRIHYKEYNKQVANRQGTIKIKNNQSKEELMKKCQEIYESRIDDSFDTRYQVKGLSNHQYTPNKTNYQRSTRKVERE